MLNKLESSYAINIPLSVFSGQAFNWLKVNDSFFGFFIDKIVQIKEQNDEYFWQTYPHNDDYEFIYNYFGLGEDYGYESIDDIHVKNAVKRFGGLRILNQDLIQTSLSFVLAQNKNIKAIRKSIFEMSKENNNFINVNGNRFYLFPNLDFFLEKNVSELQKFGVGYRADYLKNVALSLADSKFMSELNSSSDLGIQRMILKNIRGIGNKVADCIITFGLQNRSVTPIDVWGDRVLKQLYKNTRSKTYEQKSSWFTNKFGDKTAIAGQLLFEYVRNFKPEEYF